MKASKDLSSKEENSKVGKCVCNEKNPVAVQQRLAALWTLVKVMEVYVTEMKMKSKLL